MRVRGEEPSPKDSTPKEEEKKVPSPAAKPSTSPSKRRTQSKVESELTKQEATP